jgi:hypothetical protein
MAGNRSLNFEPVALTITLTTNLFNTAITSLAGPVGYTQTQPYALIKHIHVSNKTASSATVSLWKGATGGNVAGTEFLWTGVSVPANSYIDAYGSWRFDSGDFLVGGSNTATALTLTMEGEMGLSG